MIDWLDRRWAYRWAAFRRWWQERLRRKAFSHLDQAIADAGEALPREWVLSEDLDLQALRDASTWEVDTRELREPDAGADLGEPDHGGEQGPPAGRRPLQPSVEQRALAPLRYPEWPWSWPRARVLGWFLLAVVCAGVGAADGCASWVSFLGLALLLLLLWRAFQAWREYLWHAQIEKSINPHAGRGAPQAMRRASRRP